MPREGSIESMRTIALLGDSLAVSTVGASLSEQTGIQLLSVDLNAPNAVQHMEALDPDAVLFDMAAPNRDFAVALLKSNPRRLLIGVDLATNQAFVLSAQTIQMRTAEGLAKLIESRATEITVSQPEPGKAAPEGNPGISGEGGKIRLGLHT